MAVNLSPIWGAGAQLLDNSGNVLSGGKIYTYAAGTTTQVTTFTDGSGTTAHSNPIVLNSAGRVPYEIWLTDGQNYKFVLKDSNDVLIGTWDNLSGINSNFVNYVNQQEIQTATAGQTVFNLTTMNYLVGTNSLSVFVDGVNQYGPGAQYAYEETDSNTVTFASGLHVGAEVKFTSTQIQNAGVTDASQISYTYPDSNAVTQNVEERLAQYVSVKDFGAVGDGVTDDTTAFQNAISACKQNNVNKLIIGSGSFVITSQLVVDFSDFEIDGQGATIIWSGVGQDSLTTGVFKFIGSTSATTTTVSTNLSSYTSSLIVTSATGFSVGDVVYIDSPANTDPSLYLNVIAEINYISGTTFNTDVVRRLPLIAADVVNVTKLNIVKNSGIVNCNFVATGQTARANGMGGVFMQFTSNCYVKNCTFKGFWFKGVATLITLNTLVSNVTVTEPASTEDGAGYAVQYAYTYNSSIDRIVSKRVRHCVDLTGSWHIHVSDCFDSNAQSASYVLHNNYEYDIVFEKCTSEFNATDGAFTLGNVNTGFGDTTDEITLIGCSVVDCDAPYGVCFRSKGSGLRISDSLIQMRSGTVGYAAKIGNANVLITNSNLVGGFLTESDIANGAYNTGEIYINNSQLTAQTNQRSFSILSDYRVKFNNVVCNGLGQIANGYLDANNSKFIIQSGGLQYISFTGTTANTCEITFANCQFDSSISASANRNFYGAVNKFNDCSFVADPNAQVTILNATNTIVENCNGPVRLRLVSTTTNAVINNNTFTSLSGNTIINVIGMTGKLLASSNAFTATAKTDFVFTISNASNLLSSLVFANNVIKGAVVLTDAQISYTTVTGNVVEGATTYPTAGANKVVTNNVSY